MAAEPKKEYGLKDFEPYFLRIMKLMSKFKKIMREEAVAPSGALFAAYNKIVSATPEQLEIGKDELRAGLEKTRDVFDALNKKMNKLKEPVKSPFGLRLMLSASREKGRKHLLDSINASDALLRYLDSGDTAELNKAHDLLEQMTFASEVEYEPTGRG